MPMDLDHIAIAVADLESATQRYIQTLGAQVVHEELVTSQGVQVRFLQCGDNLIELIMGTDADTTVARFVAKRGEGLHHMAFRVDDIGAEFRRLKAMGLRLLQEEPVKGAWNKRIFFVHPQSMGGTLVEICQKDQP